MPTIDFRLPVGEMRAERALRAQVLPKPTSEAQKQGLRYERKVGKELLRHVTGGKLSGMEHNPWFTFYDKFGPGNCCPDFLLFFQRGIVIVEVKLTHVDVALAKLKDLYTPVVSCALGMPTLPLVICRNITPLSPTPCHSLFEAILSESKLLQWPSNGHILW